MNRKLRLTLLTVLVCGLALAIDGTDDFLSNIHQLTNGGENAEAKAVVEKALEDPDKHIQIDAHNVLVEHPEISSR